VLRAFLRGIGTVHTRRFAEEHVEREVDGAVLEMRLLEDELFFFSGLADDGEISSATTILGFVYGKSSSNVYPNRQARHCAGR
jgi:hypothetical protein